MVPPYWQTHWQASDSIAGPPPVMATLFEPGAHGPAAAGTHGCGVRTPAAADVAAETCAVIGDLHMPKGARFVTGFMSCTVAAGLEPP
jgi:hypothetical protein